MQGSLLRLSSEERLEVANRLIQAHDAFLKNGRNIEFYQFQKDFRDELVRGLITKEFSEIYYEIARQAGKTTTIAELVVFMICVLDLLMDRKVGIGFFAPSVDQYMTDWIRIREVYPDICPLYGLENRVDNDSLMVFGRYEKTPEGHYKWRPRVEIHGYSLGEGTKVESKTLDLAIIEEAQDINDHRVDNDVRPMLTATNGFICFIGVAGYRLCNFKKGVEQSPHVIVRNVDDVIKDRRVVYEHTTDPSHLAYEDYFKGELERVGNIDTDEIRTQYRLEWITERGTFITRPNLEACKRSFICTMDNKVVAGLDLGKENDSTVLTFSTELGQRLISFEYSGTDYTDQVPMIIDKCRWIQTLGYEVTQISPDASGLGTVVIELLEDQDEFHIEPFVFTRESKANLYQNFINLISVSLGISSGKIEDIGQRRFEYFAGDKNILRFEHEILELEKEYLGDRQILSCHHPDKSGAHDDYCDSVALSLLYEPKTVGFSF